MEAKPIKKTARETPTINQDFHDLPKGLRSINGAPTGWALAARLALLEFQDADADKFRGVRSKTKAHTSSFGGQWTPAAAVAADNRIRSVLAASREARKGIRSGRLNAMWNALVERALARD